MNLRPGHSIYACPPSITTEYSIGEPSAFLQPIALIACVKCFTHSGRELLRFGFILIVAIGSGWSLWWL